ncbi:MAG: DUF1329 domain-containing protein [Herbaspirillum huttiense]|uniref:DUF1329 domain-containing protein n=1 Tax=Herbaspirillum huttiense TaxID=863372 RepID=UPI001AC680E0|nr:DUF1329 domain-containing protein [Herbaspirillum huttiense]MBN9359328.1 DUF1329 domain-containing protein [Herbaspirillum huttiense]
MKRTILGLSLLAMGAALAHAASVQDLGSTLTPLGGDKAASQGVPEWKAENVEMPGWSYGKLRKDYFKYKDEKPTEVIDASNVDKYADHLTPGQVALIKQVKGYKMDIYPTHRYCAAPDFVVENTKKNVADGKIGADGWSLAEANVPGIPFPLPKTGLEVMYNSKMRYRGVGVDFPNTITAVSPRKGSNEWIKASQQLTLFYPSNVKGSTKLSTLGGVEFYTYVAYASPTALAGQALTVATYLNRPGAETFYYFPGQRRVRRMPSYAYDAPQIGMENQYTMDEPTVFNGTMDRFDWKLVGKKEIYVAYNSFGANNFKANFDDIAKPDFVAENARRYELHRVWVVEATVKPGVRHLAPKRTFYVDEDSWNLVLSDDYDAQNKLWKHREGYIIPVYETGACDLAGFAQYNLAEGRYLMDSHSAGTGKDIRWETEVKDNPRLRDSFYSADNLRAISDR